jgi:hypothetical protein
MYRFVVHVRNPRLTQNATCIPVPAIHTDYIPSLSCLAYLQPLIYIVRHIHVNVNSLSRVLLLFLDLGRLVVAGLSIVVYSRRLHLPRSIGWRPAELKLANIRNSMRGVQELSQVSLSSVPTGKGHIATNHLSLITFLKRHNQTVVLLRMRLNAAVGNILCA